MNTLPVGGLYSHLSGFDFRGPEASRSCRCCFQDTHIPISFNSTSHFNVNLHVICLRTHHRRQRVSGEELGISQAESVAEAPPLTTWFRIESITMITSESCFEAATQDRTPHWFIMQIFPRTCRNAELYDKPKNTSYLPK